MRKLILGFYLMIVFPLQGQDYRTVKTEITFFSSAPMEDIRAVNKNGNGLFDTKTGKIAFRIPIKGFEFKKSLMQQHFNEKFMESEKYPNATFEGRIKGFDLQKEGIQTVEAIGTLTIHGVSQEKTVEGQFKLSDQSLLMDAVFDVSVADYDIRIPRVLFMNIAEEVEVTVDFEFRKIDSDRTKK